MNILAWLRSKYNPHRTITAFEKSHYEKFERAVSESDVEAYVYDEHIRGQVIVLKDEDLHAVTETNLVSFRKLTRRERRYLSKVNAYHSNQNIKDTVARINKYSENNKHLYKQER